jgi:hypothetical protein
MINKIIHSFKRGVIPSMVIILIILFACMLLHITNKYNIHIL